MSDATHPDPAPADPQLRIEPSGPGAQAFWAAVAVALSQGVDIDAVSAQRKPLAIIVPAGQAVGSVQRALYQHWGFNGRPWAAPPIRPLDDWLDAVAPTRHVDPLARLLQVLAAIDSVLPSGSERRSPTERLALAAGLTQVLDSVTLSGPGTDLRDPQWLARATQAFGSALALEHLEQELSLLADLGEVLGPAVTEAARVDLDRIDRISRAWAGSGTRVAWLTWHPDTPREAALRAALREQIPVADRVWLSPDWPAVGRQVPLLRAAWPEAFDEPRRPLPERRQSWRTDPRGPSPAVLHASDREREAHLAVEWLIDRIRAARTVGAPDPKLGIIAIDRWLARRVRALLERTEVLIDDREGWLLSTTVAASAVMGWLDAIAGQGYYDDLLGWLDSPFVRPAGGRDLWQWIERRASVDGYLRGWKGLVGTAEQPEPAGVRGLIDACAEQRAAKTLSQHLDGLDRMLAWSGALAALGTDEAGRQVLSVLAALRREASAMAQGQDLAFSEFRALCSMVFERQRYRGAIESPVMMLTPADAVGRPFDALLVLGAAQGALPAPPAPLPLVNDPMREWLGLPTLAGQARRQQHELILLLALAGESAITCRTDPESGARPSPLIERLESIRHDGALNTRYSQPGVARTILARPARPTPITLSAGVPARLSVSSIEHLVACPFRFGAQAGWRLRELREPVDAPGIRERGTLVHLILERFHAGLAHDDQPLTAEAREPLLARLAAMTDRVALEVNEGSASAVDQLAEWRATMPEYLDWAIRQSEQGWRWQSGERADRVELRWQRAQADRTVRIEGRIDRIDQGPGGLRVIDYKLGSATRLKERASQPRRDAQLAMYAWFAQAGQEDAKLAEAGYLSLKRGQLAFHASSAAPDETLSWWQQQLPLTLARIDEGAPLVASGTECEYCASRGLCRKAHWT